MQSAGTSTITGARFAGVNTTGVWMTSGSAHGARALGARASAACARAARRRRYGARAARGRRGGQAGARGSSLRAATAAAAAAAARTRQGRVCVGRGERAGHVHRHRLARRRRRPIRDLCRDVEPARTAAGERAGVGARERGGGRRQRHAAGRTLAQAVSPRATATLVTLVPDAGGLVTVATPVTAQLPNFSSADGVMVQTSVLLLLFERTSAPVLARPLGGA